MPTRVYLGGKGILIDQAGGATLNIPVARASYVIYGSRPVDDIEDYVQVQFMDILTEETIIDNTLDVQDATFTPVGTTVYEVKQYLTSLIPRGSAKALEQLINCGGDALQSFNIEGARDSNNNADRDMEVDGVLTNITPFIVPYGCELTKITASTLGNETWEAHVYQNGVSVASLSITGASSGVSGDLSILFNAGDEIRLRQENGTGAINNPRIQAFFKQV